MNFIFKRFSFIKKLRILKDKRVLGVVVIVIFVIFMVILKSIIDSRNTFEVTLDEDISLNENSLVLDDISNEEEDSTLEEEISYYYVDVKGAVNNPGVYAIEVGKRVVDAIEIAGGLRSDADTKLINLAKSIKDEMVIIVYAVDEVKCDNVVQSTIGVNDAYISTDDNFQENGLVNINTASLEELSLLEGIGNSKAGEIIKYRDYNGNFESIEDIMKVSGIGESIFNKIKNNITV